MARVSENIRYKFYGCGIPRSKAITFITLYNIKFSESRIENRALVMNMTAHKQRHFGFLLIKFSVWLWDFCGIKGQRFACIEEAV